MPVTLKDIATELDISYATVSRVLGEKNVGRISVATQERVRKQASAMGYQVNHAARTLVTGQSQLLALQVYSLSAAFWTEMARELQMVVEAEGYEILVHASTGRADALRAAVDGVFLLDCKYSAEEMQAKRFLDKPHVNLGIFKPSEFDYVSVDLKQSSRAGLQRMYALGRRHIVFLQASYRSIETLIGEERFDAYRSFLAEAGLPETILFASHSTRAGAHAALVAYLSQGGKLDALFCENDEMAMGCYYALAQFGQTIPDDVVVLGCDGIEEGRYLTPSLTTIVQPVTQMCHEAWQMMKQRLENPTRPHQAKTFLAPLELRASL
jgi:DNA-binding LacI/PurR family transcriptional regulator